MRILFLCYGIVMVLALTACQENIDVFVPFDSSLSSLENGDIDRLFDDLSPEPSNLQWDAAQDQIWVSPQGVRFNIPVGAFVTPDGQVLTEGLIKLNLVEMLSAGQMIIHDKPNVASGAILEAAGNFYLEADLDGTVLEMAPDQLIQIQLPGVPAGPGLNPEMELFWGNNQNPQFFNWEPFENASLTVEPLEYFDSSSQQVYQAYQFPTDRLGWIGCSAPIVEDQPMTSLCVDLPDGYSPNNTAVYLVFQDFKGVAKLFDDETLETNTFCKEGIPTYSDALIVVLAEGGSGNYYFSSSLIHIDSSQMSVSIHPQKTNIQIILDFLNQL